MKKYVRSCVVEKYMNEEMGKDIPNLLTETLGCGLLHEVLEHAGNIIINSPRKDDMMNSAIREAYNEWIK